MITRVKGVKREGTRTGNWLTLKQAEKLVNAPDAVVAKIGAEFVMYEFRHTFATRFGEAVGDPLALAGILGTRTFGRS